MSEEIDSATLAGVTIARVDGVAPGSPAEAVTIDPDDATKLEVKNIVANKEYKVTMISVKDMAGNNISPNPTYVTVKSTLVDEVKPELVSLVSKGLDKVVAKFSEEVDETTIVTKVDTGAASAAGAGAVKSTSNPLEVEITLGSAVTPGAHAIELSAFEDLALPANVGDAVTKNVQFTLVPAKLVKTTVASDNTKVDFTFDRDVTAGTSGNIVLDFVDADMVTKTKTILGTTEVSSSGKVLTFTPAVPFEAGNYTGELTVANVTPLGATDKIAIAFEAKAAAVPAPVPTLGTINNKTVTVIYGTTDMGPSALVLDNYKVEGNAVFEKAIFKDNLYTIELTLKPGTILEDGDYQIAIGAGVKTKAGVAIKPLTLTDTFEENVAPTVTKAEFTAPDQVIITFSENVTVAADDFAIVKIGGVEVAPKFKIANISGKTATLTLEAPVTDLTKAITVEFDTDIDVTDTNGNVLVPEASYTVTK